MEFFFSFKQIVIAGFFLFDFNLNFFQNIFPYLPYPDFAPLYFLVKQFNEFFPAFPLKLRIPHAAHRAMARLMGKASLPTAFALGGLVGLCEFPCTGGPYLMVLGLLHDYATYFKGLAYLFYYNLIFILPLLVILGIASNSNLLERVKSWQRQERGVMRVAGGIAMVGLGILIFFL